MRDSCGVCLGFSSRDLSFSCLSMMLTVNIAMDPSASRDSRSEALLRAKKHNLDVAFIARETARLCLEEIIAVRSYILFLTHKG